MNNKNTQEVVKSFMTMLEKMADNPDSWPDSAAFISLDAVTKENLFTPKRLEMLNCIKNNEINSLSDLSDKLGRTSNNVSKDLSLLEDHNLVEVSKEGRRRIPELSDSHLIVLF